jgi:radical SAM protein with 4Fe4S-binding SPASM domain
MCPRTARGIEANEPMREELLTYDIITDLIERTPHILCRPAGFGEPLLDPNIPKYIKTAHDNGKLTRLLTNASLLSRQKAHALMDAGLDHCVLSVDACDLEVYEKIRRGLKWERTRSNVVDLKKIREDHRYRTYIQMNIVINSINRDVVQQIVDYWHLHVDNIMTMKEARHWKEIEEVIPIHKCFAPWETMIVLSNGDVPSCCKDVEADYLFGNVLRQTPMQVWNSEEAQDFRKRLLSNDPPRICQYCEVPIVHEYFPDRKGKMMTINTMNSDLA